MSRGSGLRNVNMHSWNCKWSTWPCACSCTVWSQFAYLTSKGCFKLRDRSCPVIRHCSGDWAPHSICFLNADCSRKELWASWEGGVMLDFWDPEVSQLCICMADCSHLLLIIVHSHQSWDPSHKFLFWQQLGSNVRVYSYRSTSMRLSSAQPRLMQMQMDCHDWRYLLKTHPRVPLWTVYSTFAQTQVLPVPFTKLRKSTRRDPILRKVLLYAQCAWPDVIPEVIKS